MATFILVTLGGLAVAATAGIFVLWQEIGYLNRRMGQLDSWVHSLRNYTNAGCDRSARLSRVVAKNSLAMRSVGLLLEEAAEILKGKEAEDGDGEGADKRGAGQGDGGTSADVY